MKIYKIIYCLILVFLCHLLFHENVSAYIISKDKEIYNIAYSNTYLAVEYDKHFQGYNSHYISLYEIETGNFIDVLSNKGEIINDNMYFPSITNDGKYLVFTSRATNITDDYIRTCTDILDKEKKYCSNIYLYDTVNKKSILIKDNIEMLNGDSYIAKISDNGTSIVFETIATNLISNNSFSCNDLNGVDNCINIYKYNIPSSKMTLISTGSDNFGGNRNSISPSISADGRFVTFQSNSSNIINLSDDYKNCFDDNSNSMQICSNVYLVDTVNLDYRIISVNNKPFNDNSGNSIISSNGRYVAYETYATNIHNYYNQKKHILVYDTNNNVNYVISMNNDVLNNRDNNLQDISDDGKYILYSTRSTNISYDNNIMKTYVYNIESKKSSSVGALDFDSMFSVLSLEFAYIYNDNMSLSVHRLDSSPPKIVNSSEIYILKSDIHSIKSKLNIVDNLSEIEKIEIYLNDNSFLSIIGNHIIEITIIDEFQNSSIEKIKVHVIEEDKEGPVFNDVNEIKILKGSSQLNLLEYVEAIDQIEGSVRIYIIDDDELDLSSSGTYSLRIMAKDSYNNVTYKDINVVVYENYDFIYFYEIIVIIIVFCGIIFLLIKVK